MPTVSCTSNVAYQNVNAHPSLTASRLQDGKILVLDSIAFFASGFAACSSFKDEGASAANVSFWSVGVSENKNDDYDCESEVYITPLLLPQFYSFLSLRFSYQFCFSTKIKIFLFIIILYFPTLTL